MQITDFLTAASIQPFVKQKVFFSCDVTQKPDSSYFLPWCSLLSLAPDSSAFPRRRLSTVARKYRPALRDRASRLSVRVPWDFRGYGRIYCVFSSLSLNKTVAFALQPWFSGVGFAFALQLDWVINCICGMSEPELAGHLRLSIVWE